MTCNTSLDLVHSHPPAYSSGDGPARLGTLTVVFTAVVFSDSSGEVLLIPTSLYLPGSGEYSSYIRWPMHS